MLEVVDIESQLKVQEETCHSISALVAKMLNVAWALRIVAERLTSATDESSAQA